MPSRSKSFITGLLKSANNPALGSQPGTEQAAFTVIANVLLNLDEALTKP